jgi:3-hydroxyisobutyrate dehydrogenase
MSAATKPTIAVLGTGRMGAPIARNLIRAGFGVIVWNRTPARAQELVDAGARLAVSPADAAGSADVVLTMLADGDAVDHAMTGPEGALSGVHPGTVWIQMATVGVDWTERLAAHARDHGLELPLTDALARRWELAMPAHAADDLAAVIDEATGREPAHLP